MNLKTVLSNRSNVKTFSGEKWKIATGANRYVAQTLMDVNHLFGAVDGGIRMHCTHAVLKTLAASQEIADGIFRLDSMGSDPHRLSERYGLPPRLYGIEICPVEDGALPDDWVVVDSPSSPDKVAVVTDVN